MQPSAASWDWRCSRDIASKVVRGGSRGGGGNAKGFCQQVSVCSAIQVKGMHCIQRSSSSAVLVDLTSVRLRD